MALVGDHEHLRVGVACAHRGHGRAAQDIRIGAVHDHQRHLRHGIELRPQRRKRLVRVEALEGVGERGIVSAHEPAGFLAPAAFGRGQPIGGAELRKLASRAAPEKFGSLLVACGMLQL